MKTRFDDPFENFAVLEPKDYIAPVLSVVAANVFLFLAFRAFL